MSRHRNFAKHALEDYYEEQFSGDENDDYYFDDYQEEDYDGNEEETPQVSAQKKKKKKNKGKNKAAGAVPAPGAAASPQQHAGAQKAPVIQQPAGGATKQAGAGGAAKAGAGSTTSPTVATAGPESHRASQEEKKGKDDVDSDDEDGVFAPTEAKAMVINVRNLRNPAGFEKQKRALIEGETAEKKSEKPHLHMVVIGHVDAGKSTLVGHLLVKRGRVSERVVQQYAQEAKAMGKSSFHFAWVLDQDEQERARGLTVDVGYNWFETSKRRISVLDCPGHRDFVPNMISGATQADVGILVVSALTGEFEDGFTEGGQTKEHAILARFLGVKNLIVAVNKLDAYTPPWCKQRYDQIVAEVGTFLMSIGFAATDFNFVPVSGFTGDNLDEALRDRGKGIEPPKALAEWYSGLGLADFIDAFPPATRPKDKPLRFIIRNAFTPQTGGFCVTGKLEAGAVVPREKLFLCPLNVGIQIKGIEVNGAQRKYAVAGESADLNIKVDNEDAIHSGQIICPVEAPVPIVSKFEAQIVANQSRNKVPLLPGAPLVLFTQCASEPAYISKIIALLAPDGTVLPRKINRFVPTDSNAIVEITLANNRKVCLERYSDYNELGRFSLRKEDETVAVGIVTNIVTQHNPTLQM